MRGIFLLLALAIAPALGADLESVNSIPANTLDSLGETAGGYGSGSAYDPKAGLLYLTSDRGPGDGTIDYSPRLFAIPLPQDSSSKDFLNFNFNLNSTEPSSARLYKDPDGQPFTGLLPDSPDAEPRMKDGRRCLDPEGLALLHDGNLFVCEEYFPSVLQFKPDGTFLARFVPPDNYLPRNDAGEVDFRPHEGRTEGREDNRGFEGVALSPDGKTVYAILQSALTQDGGRGAGATRLLALDALTGSPQAEYAVRFTDPASLGERAAKLKAKNLVFSDLLCLPDGKILALERDNRGQDGSADPKKAVFKSVCVLDLTGATDLLSLPDKPYSLRKADPKFKPLNADQPIEYVNKTLLFDFHSLDLPSKGLAWDQVPEKWEGLALLSPDRLLVIADNDFLTPELTLGGKQVPFPKCQTPVNTWWFSVRLKGEDRK